MGRRLQVEDRVEAFFRRALGVSQALAGVAQAGGEVEYVLFVLVRYWIPVVLPPPGRERASKGDPDYWLESEQILKAAAVRLRELKPLIELLTAANPLSTGGPDHSPARSPVVEVELANMLQGIAESAGSYGGPDYTSVIKTFDPVPGWSSCSANISGASVLARIATGRLWPGSARQPASPTPTGSPTARTSSSPGGKRTGRAPTRNWSRPRPRLI